MEKCSACGSKGATLPSTSDLDATYQAQSEQQRLRLATGSLRSPCRGIHASQGTSAPKLPRIRTPSPGIRVAGTTARTPPSCTSEGHPATNVCTPAAQRTPGLLSVDALSNTRLEADTGRRDCFLLSIQHVVELEQATRHRIAGQYNTGAHVLSRLRHKRPRLHETPPPPKCPRFATLMILVQPEDMQPMEVPLDELGDTIVPTGL